ncbi:hypothetical protein Nepgr_007498 [Nepenthes gracilis]|uniref:Beta-glucosidase 18-like n=1 Tax=Nepenthes gracilis TaxID=150966 RepID=A0AAD3S710_NEPGR|nr:hypothetical protein Nepgr_007498 [Nepenthes gracilis]
MMPQIRTPPSKLFPCLLLLLPLSSAFESCQSLSNQDAGDEIRRSMFPDNFLFGAATSSYQIEGAYFEDDKGLNNWDAFTHVPGGIKNGDNGDIADDHYHRYMEDIVIMRSLGLNAYRFSISWARILPRGRFGAVNPSGIMFYNKIIDNLLLNGIKPFVTINHHDIPQELEERYGGWLNPLIQEDFVELAKTCFESFGERVKHWTTINEPNLFAEMAYLRGWYPPARCSPPFGDCAAGDSDSEPLIAVHNMLLSHAKAARLYRHQFQPKQQGLIGIVVNAFMYEPYRENAFDRQAASWGLAFNVAWIIDPLIYGYYPKEMRQYHGKELPNFSPEETELVKGSLDFIGINHYSTLYAMDCLHSPCSFGCDCPIRGYVNFTAERDGIPIGDPTGMPRFFVVPRGMEKIVDYIKRRYPNLPIFVSENGYSSPEQQDELQDFKTIKFHEAYLAALARAIRNGANVRGYFIWSLMDSFEWILAMASDLGSFMLIGKP